MLFFKSFCRFFGSGKYYVFAIFVKKIKDLRAVSAHRSNDFDIMDALSVAIVI